MVKLVPTYTLQLLVLYTTALQTCITKCGGSTSGVVERCCKINSSVCSSQRSTPLSGS